MCLIAIYSKVHVCKHLSDAFPIENGLKQGDALLSLLLILGIEYTIRMIHENKEGLVLNGTHHHLVYNDVHLLSGTGPWFGLKAFERGPIITG
jgi:hypothetical protein